MTWLRSLIVMIATLTLPAWCAAAPKPDVENGRATFAMNCGVCHSVQETGGPNQGPNMLGLVGRKAGSQPEFQMYSAALKASGITWSVQTLNKFLVNPGAMVPGTIMPLQITDDRIRADVIAYLATLKKPN